MSRHLRYLRIAWTVFCGLACVLLIALWVRSYWWTEIIEGTGTAKQYVRLDSANGRAGWGGSPRILSMPWAGQWKRISQPTDDKEPTPGILGFYYAYDRRFGFEMLLIPMWFPILITAIIAAAPWLPWSNRFTLRTLLIATTIIAVVLGLIVWATRQ